MISGKNVKKPTVVKGSVESIQERAGKSVKSARDATSTFVKDGGVTEITQRGKERLFNLSIAEAITVGVILIALLVCIFRIYGVMSGAARFDTLYTAYQTELTQVQGDLALLQAGEQIVEDGATDIITFSPRTAGEQVARQQTILSSDTSRATDDDRTAALSQLSEYLTDSRMLYAWAPSDPLATRSITWSFTSNYLTVESELKVMWTCVSNNQIIAVATGIYQETTNKFSDIDVLYLPTCVGIIDDSLITVVDAIHTGTGPITGLLETAGQNGDTPDPETPETPVVETPDDETPDDETPDTQKPSETPDNEPTSDNNYGGSSRPSGGQSSSRPSTTPSRPVTRPEPTPKPEPTPEPIPEPEPEAPVDDSQMPPGTIGDGEVIGGPGSNGFLGGN